MAEHTSKAQVPVKPVDGIPAGHDKVGHKGRGDEAKGKVQGKTHGRIRDAKDLVKDMRKSHKPGGG